MNGVTPQALWATIRRARLIRVLVAYGAASFIVIQLVAIFRDQFGLPDWFFPGAIVLLIVGVPIIVTTALVQSAPHRAPGRAAPEGLPADTGARVLDLPRPTSAAEVAAVAKHWLTWRKAILGGVLAFALWGVVVSLYMVMRVLGIGPVGSLVAGGVLEARERIVLADFENHTPDSLLGVVVSEAFRVDLAQSPLVTVVDPQYLRQVLARMQRAPGVRLELELAREVALRDGINAVLTGEIGTAGTGFVLSAQLLGAETADVLAGFREAAKDSTEIIAAIDRLSKKMRERIGESLKTIRKNEPLADVTTASLEALRKYSLAVAAINEGDATKGIALLEEAVALDTTFAMAYRKLGLALNAQGEWARGVAALKKAFEYRDRLTERERYLTIGTYHSAVTDDREKAITAYRTLLDIYPNDSWALNNLALQYNGLRDYGRAEELYRRAIEVDSFAALAYSNLAMSQVALGKLEEAEATVARLAEKFPEHPNVANVSAALAALRGDYETAEEHIRKAGEARKESPFYRAGTSWGLAALARLRGKLVDAERHVLDAMAANEQMGRGSAYVGGALDLAFMDIWFRGAPSRALRRVEAALARYPLAKITPLERPYFELARLHALVGKPGRARAVLAEFDATIEPELRRAYESGRHWVLAEIAFAEGRPRDAIPEIRLGDEGSCSICALPDLGRAYDLLGERDSVMAMFERYVTTPWLYRLWIDSYFLAGIYERLGELYEERDQREKAIHYYGRLVELWKDADPELQPRVESARRAIRALSPDRPATG